MKQKTFVIKHPGIKGRLRELIDNPFTIIDETQIDKIRLKEVIERFVDFTISDEFKNKKFKEANILHKIDEIKKELGLE